MFEEAVLPFCPSSPKHGLCQLGPAHSISQKALLLGLSQGQSSSHIESGDVWLSVIDLLLIILCFYVRIYNILIYYYLYVYMIYVNDTCIAKSHVRDVQVLNSHRFIVVSSGCLWWKSEFSEK